MTKEPKKSPTAALAEVAQQFSEARRAADEQVAAQRRQAAQDQLAPHLRAALR